MAKPYRKKSMGSGAVLLSPAERAEVAIRQRIDAIVAERKVTRERARQILEREMRREEST